MPDSIAQLRSLNPELLSLAQERDGVARLLQDLPVRFSPEEISHEGDQQRSWELVGFFYLSAQRWQEAMSIFRLLYQHMLVAQENSGHWVHKGMPLVWISDCFFNLGCPVHAKRYLLLTLCEDAIREKGTVSPASTGSYFRLVWRGLPDREFRRYASRFYQDANANSQVGMFPEALLQRVDSDWLTELPSAAEAFIYSANESYIRWLLSQLGSSRGEALEYLAEYLLSCMPGCRTRRR